MENNWVLTGKTVIIYRVIIERNETKETWTQVQQLFRNTVTVFANDASEMQTYNL